MSMAADSNMSFFQHRHGVFPPSFYNHRVVSFQSAAVNSTEGLFQGDLNGLDGSDLSSRNYANVLVEPLPGLKHDTGLSVDWSCSEQAILNDGLIKFADEPGMMKYIKMASLLPDKTVRDVVLRCRWMTKENVKRRKTEEKHATKKIQYRKEKMADSSAKANMHSVPPDNMAAYSFTFRPVNHTHRFSYEEPAVDSATQHLLDENIQVLNQISANLSTYNLQDNIELFSRTSNNITAILNSMNQTPGIMSHMTPLPVSVDEDLMNSILPITSQAPMYGTTNGLSLKPEPT